MKTISIQSLLYILLALVAGLGGCSRCEHEEPMPSLCTSIKPAFASFLVQDAGILSSDTLWDRSYDTDTLTYSSAILIAKDTSVFYEWLIGSDTLHTQTVYRNSLPRGRVILIELRVRKRHANSCLSISELTDTLRRNIYIQDSGYSLIEGKFFGFRNSNESDTATLSIKYYTCQEIVCGTYFYNFRPQWRSLVPDGDPSYVYRQSSFGNTIAQTIDTVLGAYHNYTIYGKGQLDKNNVAHFVYWVRFVFGDPRNSQHVILDSTVRYTFQGKKIA